MTTANLGLQINSGQAVTAAANLNNFTQAAAGAAAATNQVAAASNTAAGAAAHLAAAVQRTGFHSRQLSFQLIDIGQSIPLAFQSPLYFLQNVGFQFAQIGQLYMGQGGLRAALRDSISMVARFAGKLGPVGLIAGAAGLGIISLRNSIRQTSGVAVSFGDTALAVFQTIRDGVFSLLRPAIAPIGGWFSEQWAIVEEGATVAGNVLVRSIVIAVTVIKRAIQGIPDAFIAAAQSAAQGFLDSMVWLARQTISILNGLVAQVNGMLNKAGAPLLPFLGEPRKIVPEAPRLNFGGAAEQRGGGMAAQLRKEIEDIYNTDYMGKFYRAVSQKAVANALAPTKKELEAAAREAERQKKAYDALTRSAEQFTAGQELERRTLTMTAKEANRLTKEQELLNKAANDNIKLTPAMRTHLIELAHSMADAQTATDRFKDTLDFTKDISKGFASDLRHGLQEGAGLWKTFADAAVNALNKIADKLSDMAIDFLINQLFSSLMGGGGGFGPAIGSFRGAQQAGGPSVSLNRGPSASAVTGPGFTMVQHNDFRGADPGSEQRLMTALRENNRQIQENLPAMLRHASARGRL